MKRLVMAFISVAFAAACGTPAEVAKDPAGPGTGGSPVKIEPIHIPSGSGGTGASRDCRATTCEEMGKDCGVIADGCGELLECGQCGKGELCGIVTANVCTNPSALCRPLTRAEACAGKGCGVEGDGCGGTYDCGTCKSGEACGVEAPFQCSRALTGDPQSCPGKIESCASVGADCGIIGNGCGGTLDCTQETGGCASGTYCGLGGPQKCGADLPSCTPASPDVACAGKCGIVSNGCGAEVDGGVIDCSLVFPCPGGQACGGSGVSNQCGSAAATCAPLPRESACALRECGAVSDGCDGSFVCGSCAEDEICRSGACAPICEPSTRAEACEGKECGVVGDGCGATYDCGACASGEQCGVLVGFTCDPVPPPLCVPAAREAACAGKECGVVYDGCGTAASNRIDCGVCADGEFCGIERAYQCDAPNNSDCVPALSCEALGWECGQAIDDCGNVFDCADEGRHCNPVQTCMGGITGPTECVSLDDPSRCPLCAAVPRCDGQPQRTRLQGRVIAPGRSDDDVGNQVGVPNAFVYILRRNEVTDLPDILSGVVGNGESCDRCSDLDLGPVLASAVTDATGAYLLEGNIPVGSEFIIAVKAGKFRRAEHYTLPESAACRTTTLPTALPSNPTRLPRNRDDGLGVNVPRIAVSTGEVDAMECLFEKMGVSHSEFSRPQLDGRIHLYRSNGAFPDRTSLSCNACTTASCRATYCGGSAESDRAAYMQAIDEASLYRSRINEYDMVVFDCEGYDWVHHDEDDPSVRQYVNRGGRMFASHYSAHWICNNGDAPYSAATTDDTGLASSANFQNCFDDGSTFHTGTGVVSLGRPNTITSKLQIFAAWLVNESAATLVGGRYEFEINQPRDSVSSVNAFSEELVFRPIGWTSAVQQYSFNTPYGAPDEAACGRVTYSGFHVAAAGTATNDFSRTAFPEHCAGAFTAQEKALLYMLFDLGACVGDEPTAPECNAVACEPGSCGPQPNGCGGFNECSCGAGLACLSGQCVVPSCVATTCDAEGVSCGVIADGCGGLLDCGPCPSCELLDRATACSGKCGFVSDGCGGVHACLDCAGGLTCAQGACVPGVCAPLTACPAGLDCGYISDGCDGTVRCGECELPEACGGGGKPNVCGIPQCVPLTCDEVGAECGKIGDGCGGSVDCGPCPGGQACGIGGKPNQCAGCEPRTCGDAGAECGMIGDGCGGIVQCGPCPKGLVCGAVSPNQCDKGPECVPGTCAASGAECGKIGDGCGGQVDCGPCPVGQLCGIAAPNQCGRPPPCTKLTCAGAGAQCGMIGDGCEGVVDCGPCPDSYTCGLFEPHQCGKITVR